MNLCEAARRGKIAALETLLGLGMEPNEACKDGSFPLHGAARNGRAAAIRVLLAAGANPDAVDKAGWTPLHHAAIFNHAESIVVLLDAGANASVAIKRGRVIKTPLDFAKAYHRTEAKAVLAEHEKRMAEGGG